MSATKRNILITGANSGIGYATAKLLSSSPENHVILACRSLTKGNSALSSIHEINPAAHVSLLELDLNSDASITAAASYVANDFGVLDVLINNAGYLAPEEYIGANLGKFGSGRADASALRKRLRETLEPNTFGPVVLTYMLRPLLLKSSDPRVINVSSSLGSITRRSDPSNPNYTSDFLAYRMSKAALGMATASQYAELRDQGVKVWAYCPGYVATNLNGEGNSDMKDTGAGSPETSAKGIAAILEGKWDAEAGQFVSSAGDVYPW